MQEHGNKYIYLIFSHTYNKMGNMIRKVTKYDYNHVSLSLSENLCPIYSFARKYFDTPFYGGFVLESPVRFSVGEHKADIKVYAIPLTDAQHTYARKYIGSVVAHKDEYLYNMVSAITLPMGFSVSIRRAYTCIEFAVMLLKKIHAPLCNKIPGFCTIKILDNLYKNYKVYDGPFPDGAGAPNRTDNYLRNNSLGYILGKTIGSNARLCGRFLDCIWNKVTR